MKQNAQKVCVVGLGYIGLPTASILADRGYQVAGVDVRPDVVDTINRGEIHIHETGLLELTRSVVKQGRFTASTEPSEADAFFLCVPTPIKADHSPDLSYVEAASKAIKPYVREGALIILESTSPPATTQNVVVPNAIPEGFTVGKDVFVAHCPERVLPGRILIEAVENDRILGGMTPACTRVTEAFYRTFVKGNLLLTDAMTAEMAKLVENSYRDVNIAFANELSMMAEKLGADPLEVIELANRHPRVNILTPGPGVGGHCISVDPWFLVHAAPKDTPLIRQAREVNNRKPEYLVEKIEKVIHAKGYQTVGCLGITYKADVDDLRESPSLDIVRELQKNGAAGVMACDPYISEKTFTEFPLYSTEDVLKSADVLVLLTDHEPFLKIPPEQLRGKEIIDPRGAWTRLLEEDGPISIPLPTVNFSPANLRSAA